jgi:rod shape-determining protein MreD
MIIKIAKDFGFGLFFILLEILFFKHLKIFGASIDPILLYILWLVQKYNRLQLLIIGSVFALIQDAFLDFWGIMMFSKTLTLFLTYNFIRSRPKTQLLLWQIFLIILGTTIIHNTILLIITNLIGSYVISYSPTLILLGNSTYTAIIGLLMYIFKVR